MPFRIRPKVMKGAALQLARFANTVGDEETSFWHMKFEDKRTGEEYSLELRFLGRRTSGAR